MVPRNSSSVQVCVYNPKPPHHPPPPPSSLHQAAPRRGGKTDTKKDKSKNKRSRPSTRTPGFYELNEEEDAATAAVGLGGARDKETQAKKRRYELGGLMV